MQIFAFNSLCLYIFVKYPRNILTKPVETTTKIYLKKFYDRANRREGIKDTVKKNVFKPNFTCISLCSESSKIDYLGR